MKVLIVANILFLSTTGALFAAGTSNSSGGFGYVPIGTGQCQVLADAKYEKPVFETSKRAPPKVVMIGTKTDCPGEYQGFKVNRLASGSVDGFIFKGLQDSGRKVFIYRKFGSSFTFGYGPAPKK
ncbi:hypothetical protein [Pleomorphomonas sp. PLEO]|uniref:hypothetical protein n=1 Tax=Pleomorphomonas sp. PLEO TaxID=3239306 RepID=UPI00351EB5CA